MADVPFDHLFFGALDDDQRKQIEGMPRWSQTIPAGGGSAAFVAFTLSPDDDVNEVHAELNAWLLAHSLPLGQPVDFPPPGSSTSN